MWSVLGSDFHPFDAKMMSGRYHPRGTLRSFIGVGPDKGGKIKKLNVLWRHFSMIILLI